MPTKESETAAQPQAMANSRSPSQLLCYFGHHRSASTYTCNILRTICEEMNWQFSIAHNAEMFGGHLGEFVREQQLRFLMYTNADIEHVRQLDEFRGFHIVRDPRDVVVSSYFSHLYSHSIREWGPRIARLLASVPPEVKYTSPGVHSINWAT